MNKTQFIKTLVSAAIISAFSLQAFGRAIALSETDSLLLSLKGTESYKCELRTNEAGGYSMYSFSVKKDGTVMDHLMPQDDGLEGTVVSTHAHTGGLIAISLNVAEASTQNYVSLTRFNDSVFLSIVDENNRPLLIDTTKIPCVAL